MTEVTKEDREAAFNIHDYVHVEPLEEFELAFARHREASTEALRAENARLRELLQPKWFYLAGDMSSDKCRFSPYEVIDEDWLYQNRGVGSAVVKIEAATTCPDIWCAVRFFTDEEREVQGSDEPYIFTEHATEEAARAALENRDD